MATPVRLRWRSVAVGAVLAVGIWATFRQPVAGALAAAGIPGMQVRATLPLPPKHVILEAVAIAARSATVRMDSDRCYYGEVDANGQLVAKARVERGPALEPSPDLSPVQVVDEQFAAFSSGTFADMDAAFAFVSPKIKELFDLDGKKFRNILEGPGMEGVIGCTEWKVIGEPLYPSEDTAIVGVKILPKPIAGCVRVSGVADQGGITWPAFYKWELARRPANSEHGGCWMLEQMTPVPPDKVATEPPFMRSAGSGAEADPQLQKG